MKSFQIYLVKAVSGLIPCVIPPVHIYILYKFWGKYSRRVDKRYCSCSCWDTVFKGTYESGVASYKHLYFNATSNTIKIWIITVVCLITLYECLKYEMKLLLQFHLRPLMAILFISSIFSHYYTWWVFVNYWNDDFYLQWNHQLFFTLTEIISTSFVLHLSNSKIPITSKKVLMILSVAIIHILSGGLDQFIQNLFWGEGYAHQVIRDLAFVIPDFLHVLLPVIELLKNRRQKKQILFSEPEPSLDSEIPEIHSEPEVQLLNFQLCVKSWRLQFATKKVVEIKKAISSLEIISRQIQLRYNELLRQLKNALLRNKTECQSLRSQIFEMVHKRHKVLTELE